MQHKHCKAPINDKKSLFKTKSYIEKDTQLYVMCLIKV